MTVSLYLNNRETDVVVDATVPYAASPTPSRPVLFTSDPNESDIDYRTKSCRILFGRSKELGEEWLSMIEKALAKANGSSYHALDGGSCAAGLNYLLGGIPETIFTDDYSLSKLWEAITSAHNHGYFIGAGTRNKMPGSFLSSDGTGEGETKDGMILGHAYAVHDVLTFSGTRLLLLQNPWGHTDWRGAWSANSKEMMKPMAKKVLNRADNTTGFFYLSLEDLKTYFDQVYFCQVPLNSWKTVPSLKGVWDNNNSIGYDTGAAKLHPNCPHYSLTVKNLTNVTAILKIEEPEFATCRTNMRFLFWRTRHHAHPPSTTSMNRTTNPSPTSPPMSARSHSLVAATFSFLSCGRHQAKRMGLFLLSLDAQGSPEHPLTHYASRSPSTPTTMFNSALSSALYLLC